MKKNPLLVIFGILATIGIVLIIIGVVVGKIISIPTERAISTKATITEIDRRRDLDGDTQHDVWIQYEVKGKLYEEKLNAYAANYREGKEIEVIYDKDNPSKVHVKWSEDLFTWIFSGMGGVFALIGITGFIVVAAKKSQKKKVEETGTIIYATYTGVERNTSITINGKNPFNIICSWVNPEDNKTYILRSDNIYYNPETIIRDMGLTTFPVYMDMENKKNYSVDISAIEQAVVDLR